MKKIYVKYIAAIVIYLFFTGMIIINTDYTLSPLMPFAPIMYGVLLVIIYRVRKIAFKSIVVLLIYATYFMRLVFIPAIYVSSGYVSIIKTPEGTNNLDAAVLLVVFELFCVSIFVLASKRIKECVASPNIRETVGEDRLKQIIRIVVIVLIFVAVACVIVDNSVLSSLSTIISRFKGDSEMDLARRISYMNARENSSLIFNLFTQCTYYLQIILPACLLTYVIRIYSQKDSVNKGYYICILVVAMSIFVVTDNNIDSVCIMLACIFVIYQFYPQKMSKQMPLILCLVGGFLGLFLLSKADVFSTEMFDFSKISPVLSAYFAGFPNVSCGFSVEYQSKITTFWGDIVSGVPYLTFFFRGLPKSMVLYNNVVYGFSGLTNQIMPLISTGYQYLGLFAPAFSVLEYYIAIRMEANYKKTATTFNKVLYAFMFVNLAVGPCIFGFSSAIKRISYFIPLLIITKINNKQKTE